MKKRLLILGGSRINIEIVNKARDMGIYTIVTDWYDVEKSPAKLVADQYFNISTTDYDKIEELIKNENIDGVITGYTDSTLVPYSNICDRLSIPCYGTKELFELFTDKSKYKKKLREYEIPVIMDYEYAKFDDLSEHDFPLLIKPVDGSGSKGIYICRELKDFDNLYNKSKEASPSKKVIVEKYVKGTELTVFFLFIDGNVYLSGIGDRLMNRPLEKEKLPLPVGYFFPSIQTDKFERDLLPKFIRMFKDVGIKDGMMFMQCMVSDGKIQVYDIGYRLTGSLEYKIQNKIQGFDSLEMLINYSLTGKMTEEKKIIISKYDKIGFNLSILAKVGNVLCDIEGLENVKKHPNIIDIVPAKDLNKEIPVSIEGTLAQITVRVLGFANNHQELVDTIKFVQENIKLKNDKGNEITQSILSLNDVDVEIKALEKKYG